MTQPQKCSLCKKPPRFWCTDCADVMLCGAQACSDKHALQCGPKRKTEDEDEDPSAKRKKEDVGLASADLDKSDWGPDKKETRTKEKETTPGKEQGSMSGSLSGRGYAHGSSGSGANSGSGSGSAASGSGNDSDSSSVAPEQGFDTDLPNLQCSDGSKVPAVSGPLNQIQWAQNNKKVNVISKKKTTMTDRNSSIYLVWGDWVPWRGVSQLKAEGTRTWRGVRLASQAAYDRAGIRACTLHVYSNKKLFKIVRDESPKDIANYDILEKDKNTNILFTWTLLTRTDTSGQMVWCVYNIQSRYKKNRESMYAVDTHRAIRMLATMAYAHDVDIDVWMRNPLSHYGPLRTILPTLHEDSNKASSEFHQKLCMEFLGRDFSKYDKYMSAHFQLPSAVGSVDDTVIVPLTEMKTAMQNRPALAQSYITFVWSVWRAHKQGSGGGTSAKYVKAPAFIHIATPGIVSRANTVYMKLVGEKSTRLYYCSTQKDDEDADNDENTELTYYIFDNSLQSKDAATIALGAALLEMEHGENRSYGSGPRNFIQVAHTFDRVPSAEDAMPNDAAFYLSKLDVLERTRGRGYGDALMVLAFHTAMDEHVALYWVCSAYGAQLTDMWTRMAYVHKQIYELLDLVAGMKRSGRNSKAVVPLLDCISSLFKSRRELARQSIERMDAAAEAAPAEGEDGNTETPGSWSTVVQLQRNLVKNAANPQITPSVFADARQRALQESMTTDNATWKHNKQREDESLKQLSRKSVEPERRPPRAPSPEPQDIKPRKGKSKTRTTAPPKSIAPAAQFTADDELLLNAIQDLIKTGRSAFHTKEYDSKIDITAILQGEVQNLADIFANICKFLRGLYADAVICQVQVFSRTGSVTTINKTWSSNIKALTVAKGILDRDEAFNTWVFYMLTLGKYGLLDTIAIEFSTLENFTTNTFIYIYVTYAALMQEPTRTLITKAFDTYFNWPLGGEML